MFLYPVAALEPHSHIGAAVSVYRHPVEVGHLTDADGVHNQNLIEPADFIVAFLLNEVADDVRGEQRTQCQPSLFPTSEVEYLHAYLIEGCGYRAAATDHHGA